MGRQGAYIPVRCGAISADLPAGRQRSPPRPALRAMMRKTVVIAAIRYLKQYGELVSDAKR